MSQCLKWIVDKRDQAWKLGTPFGIVVIWESHVDSLSYETDYKNEEKLMDI